MHPDLTYALAVLDAALQPGPDLPNDRRCPDTWEAVTTLEALGDYAARYADCLWGLLAWQRGSQPRHQARRVLEVLRACAAKGREWQ